MYDYPITLSDLRKDIPPWVHIDASKGFMICKRCSTYWGIMIGPAPEVLENILQFTEIHRHCVVPIEVQKVFEYVNHSAHCDAYVDPHDSTEKKDRKCTCGLAEAMQAILNRYPRLGA